MYRDLESIEHDVTTMFPPKLIDTIQRVARSKSVPPAYLSHSMLPVFAYAMGTAKVYVTEVVHTNNLVN